MHTRLGGRDLPGLPEADVVPDLVRSLLADAAWLEEMAAAMRRLAHPDAADEIAEGLVGLATSAGAGRAFRGLER